MLGDLSDYAKSKKRVTAFIDKIFGAEPPGSDVPSIESITIWKHLPNVTVTFCEASVRDKLLELVKPAKGRVYVFTF